MQSAPGLRGTQEIFHFDDCLILLFSHTSTYAILIIMCLCHHACPTKYPLSHIYFFSVPTIMSLLCYHLHLNVYIFPIYLMSCIFYDAFIRCLLRCCNFLPSPLSINYVSYVVISPILCFSPHPQSSLSYAFTNVFYVVLYIFSISDATVSIIPNN